jgi:5-methylcytosine-specific restriction endonuclease McrA
MIECACGRGAFDPERFKACYSCYEDRRSSYEACIICGGWHNPSFALCYKCRQGEDKEERDVAAAEMRELIFNLDGRMCCRCGSSAFLQVDHIRPCKKGGGPQTWNLQTLCRPCCFDKNGKWDNNATIVLIDRMVMFYSSSILTALLEGNEEAQLIAAMDDLMNTTDWRNRPMPPHDADRIQRYIGAHPGAERQLAGATSAPAAEAIPPHTPAVDIGPCAACATPIVRYGPAAHGTLCPGCVDRLPPSRYRKKSP